MCPMCSVPDGYGSCSSTYDFSPTGSFETSKARSASQTSCHFFSIACGSYLSIKKASLEAREFNAAAPRSLPALPKQLLLHRELNVAAWKNRRHGRIHRSEPERGRGP